MSHAGAETTLHSLLNGGPCPSPVYTGKNTFFEEDIRVPFFISGPGIPAQSRLDVQATMVDVAPTVLALTGE